MSTFIVGALVFGLLAAAILKVVRDRRSGSCGCGCGGCGDTQKDSEDPKTDR
jgi:hypothetical protein